MKTERNNQIISYYDQGLNHKQIAELMGLKMSVVYQVLIKRGRKPDIRTKVHVDDEFIEYLKNHFEGEAAEKYGVSKSCISHIKLRYNLESYNPGWRKRGVTRFIVEELKKGELTQSEIGRKYNRPRQLVYAIKTRFGL